MSYIGKREDRRDEVGARVKREDLKLNLLVNIVS